MLSCATHVGQRGTGIGAASKAGGGGQEGASQSRGQRCSGGAAAPAGACCVGSLPAASGKRPKRVPGCQAAAAEGRHLLVAGILAGVRGDPAAPALSNKRLHGVAVRRRPTCSPLDCKGERKARQRKSAGMHRTVRARLGQAGEGQPLGSKAATHSWCKHIKLTVNVMSMILVVGHLQQPGTGSDRLNRPACESSVRVVTRPRMCRPPPNARYLCPAAAARRCSPLDEQTRCPAWLVAAEPCCQPIGAAQAGAAARCPRRRRPRQPLIALSAAMLLRAAAAVLPMPEKVVLLPTLIAMTPPQPVLAACAPSGGARASPRAHGPAPTPSQRRGRRGGAARRPLTVPGWGLDAPTHGRGAPCGEEADGGAARPEMAACWASMPRDSRPPSRCFGAPQRAGCGTLHQLETIPSAASAIAHLRAFAPALGSCGPESCRQLAIVR